MHIYLYHTQKKCVTSKISRRPELEIYSKEGFLNFTMCDFVFWIFPTITCILQFYKPGKKNEYIYYALLMQSIILWFK